MPAKKKSPKVTDLTPRPRKVARKEAGSIKGGKGAIQDFHFVKTVDKSSAKLY